MLSLQHPPFPNAALTCQGYVRQGRDLGTKECLECSWKCISHTHPHFPPNSAQPSLLLESLSLPPLFFCFVLFCFCGTGVWTQTFMFAKQALYHLIHTSNPFCSCYFGNRVSQTVYQDWPWTKIILIPTSQVARITGVSHWHPASLHFCGIIIFRHLWVIRGCFRMLFLPSLSFCIYFTMSI
jgi:hypothetical protein